MIMNKLVSMIKERLFWKLVRLSRESWNKGRFENFSQVLINRIKFEVKKQSGIVLTIDHARLFCGRIGVSGWALSNKGKKGIARIEIYLDETFLGNAIYGDSRADVKRVYPFVKHGERCGFHFYTDASEIFWTGKGKHNLLIKAIGRDGRSSEKVRPLKDYYFLWVEQNEPHNDELEKQKQTTFPYEPKISLITPTYNTPKQFLIDMVKSVLNQTYTNWELCIADGTSQDDPLKNILEAYSKRDSRVKVKFLSENKGIAGNSNEALALATGDFIGFLDHDDTLAPFALFEVVKNVNENKELDYLYSDEDRLSEDGTMRYEPHFKPDWSPDLLRSTNYPTHFSVFRKELIARIGGLREGFEGSQDYDLILRGSEKARKIAHIPKVLYHWRVHDNSLARDALSKGWTYDAARKALQEHLERVNLQGKVEDTGLLGYYRVTYRLQKSPKLSIIIPNHEHADNLKRCVNSIIEKSSYQNFEMIIIENGSCETKTFALYEKLKKRDDVQIIEWNQPFNYAAVNNFAVNYARGEVLLFLNNDTQVINSDWLERMLEHAVRHDVGAVGAKLYYPDHTIQHAGIIVGLCGVAGYCHKFFPGENSGYKGRLKIVQNFSAVTAACLMIRNEVFQEVGGFDERYSLAYNDVDLCLKIREKGYVIVWTPYAELYHDESKTRGYEDDPEKQGRFQQEKELFRQKWSGVLERGDPYYNPNLTLEREDFSVRA
jgi:GT2 family glycosyltransferase